MTVVSHSLKNGLNIVRQNEFTFIFNKQKGLIATFQEVLPTSDHRFCVKHLHNNFKGVGFKGLAFKNILWRVARTTKVSDYKTCMQQMRDLNPTALDWFKDKSPLQWSKSHFSEYCKCDILLNNICESFNRKILEARKKAIITIGAGRPGGARRLEQYEAPKKKKEEVRKRRTKNNQGRTRNAIEEDPFMVDTQNEVQGNGDSDFKKRRATNGGGYELLHSDDDMKEQGILHVPCGEMRVFIEPQPNGDLIFLGQSVVEDSEGEENTAGAMGNDDESNGDLGEAGTSAGGDLDEPIDGGSDRNETESSSESSDSSSDDSVCSGDDLDEHRGFEEDEEMPGYPMFNPVEIYDPPLTLGLQFSTKIEFRKVIDPLAIKTRRTLKVTRNDTNRVYVRCGGECSGWTNI
ncbi:hypothetical protein BUALT_BualtUnG0033700 [Buddleja alternifolia]|uniref:Transposase MuDR plant domain-containing protein n=1 Tax=Buddleja alternifolia TaxID=168488 RepID=A0AAV6W0E7_9LAMI|nr:hypothetical protein BUALT_BualtUnG0033700 [Buddleja alternifolia]